MHTLWLTAALQNKRQAHLRCCMYICVYLPYTSPWWVRSYFNIECMACGSVQLCKTDRQHPCVTSCTPKHICIRYELTVGKGNALQQLLKTECNGLWLSAAPQNRQTAPLWHCMYTYACLPNIKAYSLQRFLRCSTCLTLNAMACGPMLSCKTV